MQDRMPLPIRVKEILCACWRRSLRVCLYLLMSSLMPGSVEEPTRIRRAGLSRAGDLLIGGIFPVHVDVANSETLFTTQPEPTRCHTFVYQHFQWIQAMLFAIEEINRNPDLLPNITLGFRIYDSCVMLRRSLEGTLWMLTGQEEIVLNYCCQPTPPLSGIVGEASSTHSIALARLLGIYRYPQVSYFSSSPLLSDRNQFPSFFRTIPSDDFQSRGLAQLVTQFGWTWVGLLAEDSEYGQQGIQLMKQQLVHAGVCIAFSESILTGQEDKNAPHIVQVIRNSSANAIAVFSLDEYLLPVLEELMRQNVTGKIWIASEAWSTSDLLSNERFSAILIGTIGFAIQSRPMPGFKEHLIRVIPTNPPGETADGTFWQESLGCQLLEQNVLINKTASCALAAEVNSLNSAYKDAPYWRVTYNVYAAVYAIARALHALLSHSPEKGPFLLGFKPWQLLHHLKHIETTEEDGSTRVFDMHGNPTARYDVVNWQLNPVGTVSHVIVGSFDSRSLTGMTLRLNVSTIRWPSGSTQVPLSVCSSSCPPGFRKAAIEGAPACCFQCVSCPMGEFSNQTDSIDCFKCPIENWPSSRQDRCIPKTVEFLTYDEPLGVTLATASIFFSLITVAILALFVHSRNTPIVKANNRSLSYLQLLSLTLCFLCSLAFIGYPTPEKCLLRQAAFGITFAHSISCILAKTIVVVIAFNATKPNSTIGRWARPKLSYTVIAACTSIQVLLCVLWLVSAPPLPGHNTHTNPGTIIIECNERCPTAFWCMLGYLGILATISFIMAFLTRKLPSTFNDAKLITFSMLAFLSVWISFIPAYLSTKGKYMVAMEIFSIFFSSCGLLSCIFFPKCYIILFQPEKNMRRHLMNKG